MGGCSSRIQVEVDKTTECMYGDRNKGRGYRYRVIVTKSIELKIA